MLEHHYQQAKELGECLRVMSLIKKGVYIDPGLFNLFLKVIAWWKYAEQFLYPDQVDDVNINEYLDQPVETAAQ